MCTRYHQKKNTYVEEVIEMVLVFVIVEATAIFTYVSAFSIAIWFENVSWLEKDLASVLIDLLEPVPQLLVSVGVVVEHIDRILDLVHVPAIGEPFEKRPQFASGFIKSGILGANIGMALVRERFEWWETYLCNIPGLRTSVPSSIFTVGRVGFESVKQPLQAGLIIVMFLALNDYFLSAVDELIATLLGEVLVCQEILGTVESIANTIFMLLRNPVR